MHVLFDDYFSYLIDYLLLIRDYLVRLIYVYLMTTSTGHSGTMMIILAQRLLIQSSVTGARLHIPAAPGLLSMIQAAQPETSSISKLNPSPLLHSTPS